MRTANITIHTKALNHNIQQISSMAPNTNMMVMLKANAYGHGLDVCALALLHNDNVNAVGVATMEEAIRLRTLGWHKSIVLMEGVFSFQEWQNALRYELQSIIHHEQQLIWATQLIPKTDSPTRTLWLKYNTGMNRLGFDTATIADAAQKLSVAGYSLILTSHFANADIREHPLNQKQGVLFNDMLTHVCEYVNPDIQGSLCNSAATVNFPKWHYDWIRIGIMAYGSSPFSDKTATQLQLRPVMNFSCKVLAIHTLSTGEVVGYGSRWTAKTASTIAIISAGYGDGYPRVIDDRAFAVVYAENNGHYYRHHCPIIGRVAMDMMMIDITEVKNTSAADQQINIDDKVILWGNEPHIDTLADAANTISYELFCRLTNRPKRIIDDSLAL